MRYTIRGLALIGVLSTASAHLVAQAQSSRSPSATQASLSRLYQRFLTGIRLRDTATYRAVLAPDYVFIGGDSGTVVTGRDARIRRDARTADRWDVFEVERCELTVHSNTAVGPCYHAKGLSEGKRGDWHGV